MKSISKSSKGFTLVEIIVVLIIIAILAAVAIPAVFRYIEDARIAVDKQLVADLTTIIQIALIQKDILEAGGTLQITNETVVVDGETITRFKFLFGGNASLGDPWNTSATRWNSDIVREYIESYYGKKNIHFISKAGSNQYGIVYGLRYGKCLPGVLGTLTYYMPT